MQEDKFETKITVDDLFTGKQTSYLLTDDISLRKNRSAHGLLEELRVAELMESLDKTEEDSPHLQ